MIKFNRPTNLNGTELLNELNNGKVKITEPPTLDGNGDLWLNIDPKDQAKAKSIVDAHNGTVVAPDLTSTRQAIFDRLGLTADEAKLLLG